MSYGVSFNASLGTVTFTKEASGVLKKAATDSIVASLDLKAGTKLREEHIDTKRPGSGLAPNQCNRIIGRRLKVDIKVDTLLDESMFED